MSDNNQIVGQAIAQAVSAIANAIRTAFPSATGTSNTASGGSATLPSNPAGFITTNIPGTTTVCKIPYYN